MSSHSDPTQTLRLDQLTEQPISKLSDIESSSDARLACPESPAQDLGIYVTIHGHFYQPPRENPYLGMIEGQSSAAPFRNWNERIHHECYRPNAFARVLNDRGEVVDIINNFEYLSFNIGPTLMSWLEHYDAEVYQRILEADRKSCERLNGHGNAIAQAYNHMILPLANERDKITQIRWGKADFQARFGREPEGMWLAEAAVDYPTLAVLIKEGIRFIILAPSQAERCRPLISSSDPEASDHPWSAVGGGQIDPVRPYRCFLPDGDRDHDYIDIFFYDGPISADIGFDNVLSTSSHLAGRLAQAVRKTHSTAQLISVATDGETFGHHKSDTEKTLAYALTTTFPQWGWTVTNYAHYLSLHPPTWEVELKPVTAWSCAHGVDRWQVDCGCGGEGSLWHQQWRRPLRDALDWLRDELSERYTDLGQRLFSDPWQARDHYIQVLGQPSLSTLWDNASGDERVVEFLQQYQAHPLTVDEQVDALRLLEMQRHTLLMYTSCGWFFAELSRPEGVQILRYAARAIALAADVSGVDLEPEFIQRLALAPSNVTAFQDGAGVYAQLVKPSQVSLQRVAAHYAMNSLFNPYPDQDRIYCYQVQRLDYQLQHIGSLTVAVGQLCLTSEVTHESEQLVFGMLHLGGWEFHCGVQPFAGRKHYADVKEQLFDGLHQGVAQAVLALDQAFGSCLFGLQDLFPDERQRMMGLLTQTTLNRLDQLYSQVYRDNYGVLMAFQQDNLAVPQPLLMAAQVALSHRAMHALKGLEQDLSSMTADEMLGSRYFVEVDAIATEANHLGCTLTLGEAQKTLEDLTLRLLWQLLQDEDLDHLQIRLQHLEQLLAVGPKLGLTLSLNPAQELYFYHFQTQLIPQCEQYAQSAALADAEGAKIPKAQLCQLLKLGQKLAIAVDFYLDMLAA
jgi:alpha-amylase/alpha-mannosidase (GH57 family)